MDKDEILDVIIKFFIEKNTDEMHGGTLSKYLGTIIKLYKTNKNEANSHSSIPPKGERNPFFSEIIDDYPKDLKWQIQTEKSIKTVKVINTNKTKALFTHLTALKANEHLVESNNSTPSLLQKKAELASIDQEIKSKRSKIDNLDKQIEDVTKAYTEMQDLENKIRAGVEAEQIKYQEMTAFLQNNAWVETLRQEVNPKSPVINKEEIPESIELPDIFWIQSIQALQNLGLTQEFAECYLLSVLTSLIQGRFLLLTGHIGTGKSRLIKRTGELFGDTAPVIIPVRTGWLDASDLLGYYNPLDNDFYDTQFTRALRQDDNHRLNVILLDEMNIARIENYAADILACHGSIYERTEIELFDSDHLSKPAFAAILLDKVRAHLSFDDQSKLKNLLQCHVKNKNTLRIKSNVLICGTLNIDGSTENLSPKMIDRSFMLKFPDFDGVLEIAHSEKMLEKIILPVNALHDLKPEINQDNKEDWTRFYEAWVEPNRSILLTISHRVALDYLCYLEVVKHLNPNYDIAQINQYFAYARLLPRMNFFSDSEKNKLANDFLDDIGSEFTASIKAKLTNQKREGIFVSYQDLCG